MLFAKTNRQKAALGKALSEHDADMLADIKLFADAFGPLAEVGYEAEDFAKHKEVVRSALSELQRLNAKAEEHRQAEMEKVKRLTQ